MKLKTAAFVLQKMASVLSPSSSSPATTADGTQVAKYDVFLSFRGSDTRDNFTSHLHAALDRRKIHAFVDTGLHRGREIVPSLSEAIHESEVAVVIFSENYGGSPWCLDELVKIMECRARRGMVVLPVFYHVDPSDVEEQSGVFGDGFGRLKARYSDDVDKWSDALKDAARIAGLDWRNHRPDHRLTEEVAELVLKELQGLSVPGSLTVDANLVGMELHVEEMLSLLQTEAANVLFFGIWGMGGIGKTTCAEALLYQISRDFESSYFLANVREESRKRTAICLRNEVLGKILSEEITVNTSNMLPGFILNRLRRKKVLIILDDLSSEEQLTTIAGDPNWYGPGSRIIVTSRDKQVLVHRVDRIYEVQGLNYGDALQLFSLQAFKQSSPNTSYLELSKMILNYARGVPLALKVLGSLLYKKHPDEWNSKLEKLRTMPERQVLDVLKISYDELDEDEQNIFLDIACFFKGEDKALVKDILDGCGFFAGIGISRLHDKCLITIADNKLQMHDLLQEMGWDIVHKESNDYGKRSRLWKAEDILLVLTRNMGCELTQSIILDMDKIKIKMEISQAFSKMCNLRLLKLHFGSYLTWGNNEGCISETSGQSSYGLQYLPSCLRYLHWHGYPWKTLPYDFFPGNLVDLSLCFSKIERLWSEAKVSPQLKRIDLSCSFNLILLPDLSSAVNLEKIILDACGNLLEVPTSIQHLKKLVYLSLSNCWKIRSLPSLVHLKSLQTLNLSSCSGLEEFPEVPANIQELNLDETGLEEWPQSIQFLNDLHLLTLKDCRELRRLPSTLHLASLETFDLSWCPNLRRIPDILGMNLKVLDLVGSEIELVPPSIGCLTSLLKLKLSFTNIKELPVSIGNLSSLVELNLESTEIVELPSSVGSLSSLVELKLGLTSLKGLPTSIGRLTNLVKLDLGSCKRLSSLPSSICELKSLKELIMHICPRLCKLPPLRGLHSLTVLDLGSSGILELPASIGYLSALQRLYLRESDIQQIPPSIERLSLLEELDIRDCKRLECLPKLPCLVSIVNSTNCSSIKKVACSAINAIEKAWQHCLPPDYRFIFSNCTHLDVSGRENIMYLLRVDRDIETTLRRFSATSKYPGRPKFRVCLPGTRIPEWFQYQSRGSCICASFSACRYKTRSIGLALSVVVEFPGSYDNIGERFNVRCKCNLTKHDGDVLHLSFDIDAVQIWNYGFRFESDHVFIWLVRDLHNGTESDETYLSKATFEFSASSQTGEFKVEMCGAHVVCFPDEDQYHPTSSECSSSNVPK